MTNKKTAILNESKYWWLQRLCSILLILLFIWFTVTCISFITSSPAESITFAQIIQYITLGEEKYLFFLLGILTFLHISLGIEEIIEDYIHSEKAKLVASVLVKVLILRLVHEQILFFIDYV